MAENEQNTNTNPESESGAGEGAQTFTKEEVLKLIQSESDKRVAQALATQQRKFEKQMSLSKLDGAEREKAEKDNRIAELEEQLAQYNKERNKSELKSVLGARGLNAEFADLLHINDNLEESQQVID